MNISQIILAVCSAFIATGLGYVATQVHQTSRLLHQTREDYVSKKDCIINTTSLNNIVDKVEAANINGYNKLEKKIDDLIKVVYSRNGCSDISIGK